jgi:hypothetical protein
VQKKLAGDLPQLQAFGLGPAHQPDHALLGLVLDQSVVHEPGRCGEQAEMGNP